MDLYLIRHGQTASNAQAILQGPRMDPPLDAEGRRQVVQLAKDLPCGQLDRVLVSPLQRAQETAQALVASGAPDPDTWPALPEVDYGSFCGVPLEECREDAQAIFHAWAQGDEGVAFPEGESALDVKTRLQPLLHELRGAPSAATWAVVAHGRLHAVLLAMLLGTSLATLVEPSMPNASFHHLRRTEDGWELAA